MPSLPAVDSAWLSSLISLTSHYFPWGAWEIVSPGPLPPECKHTYSPWCQLAEENPRPLHLWPAPSRSRGHRPTGRNWLLARNLVQKRDLSDSGPATHPAVTFSFSFPLLQEMAQCSLEFVQYPRRLARWVLPANIRICQLGP